MKIITRVLGCAIVCLNVGIATVLTSAQTSPSKDEPTAAHLGQFTEKQKQFSREYKKLYAHFNGRKLGEIAAGSSANKRKGEAGVSIGIPTFPTVGPSRTAAQYIADLSCQAEVIVRGIPQSKTALPTEDGTFVYSEYEFLVKDVLKNHAVPIEKNGHIQVTRPGGSIKLGDQIIRVEDRSYKPLYIGDEYLLFLRYIPSADGYIVATAEGDFLIRDNSFEGLSVKGTPTDLRKDDLQTLFGMIRDSESTPCATPIAGGE